jgi:hypothetical protein
LQTELKILNWNIAGAKYFGLPTTERDDFRDKVNSDLQTLIRRNDPDVIAIQEAVVVHPTGSDPIVLIDEPDGYTLLNSILIDSDRHPYVEKWQRLERDKLWPSHTYFGQGLGILWRNNKPGFHHFAIWDIPRIDKFPDGKPHVEEVILMSGLYFGSRDTEPRAAIVSHFVVGGADTDGSSSLPKPLDVFVVNCHLTTLKNEREGIPAVDREAAQVRSHQMDIILNGIVSRYNRWCASKYRVDGVPLTNEDEIERNRYSPIWILCGDFNFSPESEEYNKVMRANFLDVCPQKGRGNKSSGFGGRPQITVDYIFAGPKLVSLDPVVVADEIRDNPLPDYNIKVSDHYPIFAHIPLTPR